MKRTLRTSLAFLLTLTLILGSFSGISFGATASSPGESSWWDYRAESVSDFNASSATLTIHTPQELALFSYMCSNPTSYHWPYQTVKLGSNISLYGHQWEPIHTDYTFTFDGNGYSISGMTITGTPEVTIRPYGMADTVYLGLFGNGRGVTIRNLNMQNVKIDIDLPADGYLSGYVLECGAIAGWAANVTNCFALVDMNFDTGYEIGVAGIVQDASRVEDCAVRGSFLVNAAGGCVSGIVGEADYCFRNTNYASIVASGISVGGVFGWIGEGFASQTTVASNCVNEGDITFGDGFNIWVGGVGHSAQGGKISRCYNRGDIIDISTSDRPVVGGILGKTEVGYYPMTISECQSTGVISLASDQSYAGGVVGDLDEHVWEYNSEESLMSSCSRILDCECTSYIEAGYVGGIAATSKGYIASCRMSGNLVGREVGGIVSQNSGIVESCENNSDLTTEELLGGIAAVNEGKISASRNYKQLYALRTVGGIAGRNLGTITGCANYGTIRGSGEATIGGIAGQFEATAWSSAVFECLAVIENCENAGTVDGSTTADYAHGNIGGIVGDMGAQYGDTILRDSMNSGTVRGTNMAGGIVGTARAESFWSEDPSGPVPSAMILRCENQGDVMSSGTSGGIVANMSSWTMDDCVNIVVEDVYNRGFVSVAGADEAYSSSAAGGIIGTAHDEGRVITIRNAFHMGSVSCNIRNVGAIAGSAYNMDLSDDLYYQKLQGLDGVGGGYIYDENTGYGWEYDENLMVGLTPSQLADPTNFKGFDFDQVWTMSAGHPVLQDCGLSGAEVPTRGYYMALTDKLFRFLDPTTGYPQPFGFTLKVGNLAFSSGSVRELGVPMEISEDETVLCMKEGYHTYELPAYLITSYNVITMTPSSVTSPFAETLLMDKTSGSYKGYTNLRAEGASVYESDLSQRDTQKLYVSVNWNGHGEGSVWLEQDGVRLDLLDGGFIPAEIGSVFTAGPSIYLCGEAEDGTVFRHSTKLSVIARHVTDGIDMGLEESLTIDGSLNDNLGFLDSQSFALNFSALSGGAVPLKVKIDGETIKGTIGVSVGKEEYEKKSDGTAKHEQDNMFDMVKEFVDMYKKGSEPGGSDLLEQLQDKKLK